MSKTVRKFWNWVRNDSGENILRLEGPIDEQNFWGDSVTPQQFREELDAVEGDVTVWINSPGGNVFCGAEIYTMLCDHKGSITVKIDAIAASAASVIAMAGDRVLMSPVGMILIHDPMTIAMGNTADMEKAIATLNEVKESIINAYCRKTGLSRNKVSKLMSDETWMNARKAVELGFIDEILFGKDAGDGGESDDKELEAVWKPYSTKAMGQRVLNWLLPANTETAGTDKNPRNPACGEKEMELAKTETAIDSEDRGEAVCGTDMEVVIRTESDGLKPSSGGNSGDKESKEDDHYGDFGVDDSPKDSPKDDPIKIEANADKVPMESKDSDQDAEQPAIGLDGRTADGGMSYAVMKMQLDFLT